MAFDRLSDIFKKAQERFPAFKRKVREAEAVARWDSAVGPAIAKHAQALRVQESVIWVEVDHPIWKSELHHRKRQILDILNQGLDPKKEALKDIFFIDKKFQVPLR